MRGSISVSKQRSCFWNPPLVVECLRPLNRGRWTGAALAFELDSWAGPSAFGRECASGLQVTSRECCAATKVHRQAYHHHHHHHYHRHHHHHHRLIGRSVAILAQAILAQGNGFPRGLLGPRQPLPWAIPLPSPFGSAGGLRRYSTSFSPCPPLPSWSFVLELFFVVFLLTVANATTLPRLVPAALPLLYLVLPFFLVVVLEALTLNAGWCPPRSLYSTWSSRSSWMSSWRP